MTSLKQGFVFIQKKRVGRRFEEHILNCVQENQNNKDVIYNFSQPSSTVRTLVLYFTSSPMANQFKEICTGYRKRECDYSVFPRLIDIDRLFPGKSCH